MWTELTTLSHVLFKLIALLWFACASLNHELMPFHQFIFHPNFALPTPFVLHPKQDELLHEWHNPEFHHSFDNHSSIHKCCTYGMHCLLLLRALHLSSTFHSVHFANVIQRVGASTLPLLFLSGPSSPKQRRDDPSMNSRLVNISATVLTSRLTQYIVSHLRAPCNTATFLLSCHFHCFCHR